MFLSHLDHDVVLVPAGDNAWIRQGWARPEHLIHGNLYLGPGRRDAGSAKRAVGVVLKPDIDAIYVEEMAAIRYGPKLFSVNELIQTNRAFGRILRFVFFRIEFLEFENRY